MTKKTELKNTDKPVPDEQNEIVTAEPLPRIKLREDEEGLMHLEIKIASQASMVKAIGTADTDFIEGLMVQLVNAGLQGHATDGKGVNFMLSVVKGIEPQDQIEAMLASQMAAVQMATMTFARRLAHTETIDQQDSAMRGFTKLTRCFTAQVEALKKYRSKGQKVTVEHVTVNEGGQAIVGNVGRGEDGKEK